MNESTLFNALKRLTAVTQNFSDADLSQPYAWRAHGEGVRMALLGSHYELQELVVKLADQRAKAGPPLTKAQHILGQFHVAYRDLQGVLTGFDTADYDKKPTPNDWSMRTVLAHMARAQRTFVALADYGLKMGQDAALPKQFPNDAADKIFGPFAPFQDIMENKGLVDMMTLFDEFHQRTLTDFVGVSDEELEVAGPIWWEREGYPIHYRLGRMEAHLRQHTIQAVKTRTAVSGPLDEATQLLRLLYNAVATIEAAVLGTPNLGQAKIAAVAEKMLERADEIGRVYRQTRGLVEAVKKGETAVIENLLELNPALAKATDQMGIPVIMVAVYHHQTETAELLRKAGAEIHIFEAAALGDLETVKEEVAGWPEDIHAFGRDGFNPLQLACYFGHLEVAKYLVEKGADVNTVAQNGQKIRPIHAAAANGSVEIVELLLENGADVNAVQTGDFTALKAATHHSNKALIELLLKYGANPEL